MTFKTVVRVKIVEQGNDNLLTEYDSKNDLNVFIEGRRYILIPGGDLSVSFPTSSLKGTYKINRVAPLRHDDGKDYIDVFCDVLLPPGTRHPIQSSTGGGNKKKKRSKNKRTKKKRRRKKKTRGKR